MKYWRTTLFEPGPPMDVSNTTIVYCAAEDEAALLPVALDLHSKPVWAMEEVTKEVYDANQ